MMKIKGYIVSKKHSRLWELINDGYRIPAFIESKDDDSDTIKMVEVVFRLNYYYIKGGGNIYSHGQSKNVFLNICTKLNLHFIELDKEGL